jgi:hypothetical protein
LISQAQDNLQVARGCSFFALIDDMRSFIIGVVGLIGLATAQSGTSTDLSASSSVQSTSSASSDGSSSTTSAPPSSVPSATTSTVPSSASSVTTSATSSVVASSTNKATAITVALDGSAEFTAINAAVAAAQNRAIPTVTIQQAGTYSETVVIQGTQALTIVGPTASSYAGNQVNIVAGAAGGTFSFNTQKNLGIVLRNINITNTISVTNAKAPAFLASGSNMLLDTVALISGGVGVYQAGLGTTLITNSYIEGNVPAIHDKF